jgi:3-oxoacyl-[acyl-carrier protein] reductase
VDSKSISIGINYFKGEYCMNIVVVGGTGGIGSALVRELSLENNIFIGSRIKTNIDNLITNLSLTNNIKNNNIISGDLVDAQSFDSMKLFLSSANNFLGSIDCIINCVGSVLLKPAHLTSEDDLDAVIKTNLYSCFSVLKYGFKYLKKTEGSIVFFSSAASKVGLKNHEAISSAKAAVSALALSGASTYAKYNIRINAIAPGLVETPLTQHITSNDMSLDYSKKLHGLGRIGNPDNFIPIIKALIDKRSDWITGQTFSVDGGLSNIK